MKTTRLVQGRDLYEEVDESPPCTHSNDAGVAAESSVGLGSDRTKPETANEVHAQHLKETAASMFMYASLGGFLKQVDAPAYRMYRDQLLASAGNPVDPIEIMLLEQIALAHLTVGRLHFQAATAQAVEIAKAYGSMAIALTGEFRRTALALQVYRAGGHARVVAGEASAAPAVPTTAVDERSRGLDAEIINSKEVLHERRTFAEESPTRCGRQEERLETQGPDSGRSRAGARRHVG